jgi:hypothetical protein
MSVRVVLVILATVVGSEAFSSAQIVPIGRPGMRRGGNVCRLADGASFGSSSG